MPPATETPKAAPGEYKAIAAQYARAKAIREEEERARLRAKMLERGEKQEKSAKSVLEKINERKAAAFRVEWYWVVGFFVWLL